MPKETTDIRDFLKKSRQKDAKGEWRASRLLLCAGCGRSHPARSALASGASMRALLSQPRGAWLARAGGRPARAHTHAARRVARALLGSSALTPAWRVAARAVVKVKKVLTPKGEVTKFKLRLSKYLYTLKVEDKEKAAKISQSFPPGASGLSRVRSRSGQRGVRVSQQADALALSPLSRRPQEGGH